MFKFAMTITTATERTLSLVVGNLHLALLDDVSFDWGGKSKYMLTFIASLNSSSSRKVASGSASRNWSCSM